MMLAGVTSVIQATSVLEKSIKGSATLNYMETSLPDGLYKALNSIYCPMSALVLIKIVAETCC